MNNNTIIDLQNQISELQKEIYNLNSKCDCIISEQNKIKILRKEIKNLCKKLGPSYWVSTIGMRSFDFYNICNGKNCTTYYVENIIEKNIKDEILQIFLYDPSLAKYLLKLYRSKKYNLVNDKIKKEHLKNQFKGYIEALIPYASFISDGYFKPKYNTQTPGVISDNVNKIKFKIKKIELEIIK